MKDKLFKCYFRARDAGMPEGEALLYAWQQIESEITGEIDDIITTLEKSVTAAREVA